MEGLDPVAAQMNDPRAMLAGDAGRSRKGGDEDKKQDKQQKATHG
jgi:hypothetical protein